MTQNPMCKGDHCQHETGEVRKFILWDDVFNLFCEPCFAYENADNARLVAEGKSPEIFPQCAWDTAEIYTGTEIPANIMNGATEYLEMFSGILLTDEEFQAIAREGGIIGYIISGGEFATGEREVFQDAMVKIFTDRDHWPMNCEPDDLSLPEALVAGLEAWRAKRVALST